MSIGLIAFAVLVAGLLLYPVMIYNTLVSLRNYFKNAFSQINVQLQRRYDLIPNLVETAKAYMQHEKGTLQAVIDARNQAATAIRHAASGPENPQAIQDLIGAETKLDASLGRFFALAENYPDLKANQTMAQLMEELSSTENRVAFARQAYNDAVMNYNTYRERFPNIFIADPLNFGAAQMFEVENPASRQPVRVSF